MEACSFLIGDRGEADPGKRGSGMGWGLRVEGWETVAGVYYVREDYFVYVYMCVCVCTPHTHI